MIELVELRTKMYPYLMDDDSEIKNKRNKKVCNKNNT